MELIMKWNTFLRPKLIYGRTKLIYSASLSTQKRLAGQIGEIDAWVTCWKNFYKGRMTYLHRSEGQEMAPTIPGQQETLLIRKLPCFDSGFMLQYKQVSVGDVVLLRSPLASDKFLVRRLAALGGQEMASTNKKEEPFVIDHDHCWVLSDNKKLKAVEAKDSRTFGPVPLVDIKGRVIYRFQALQDNGFVKNSKESWSEDLSVLKFELQIAEMLKFSEPETPL